MIGWVFFRADTLPAAIAFLKAMAGLTVAAPTPYTVGWYLTPELWLALIAGAIGSTPWVPALRAHWSTADRPDGSWRLQLVSTTALIALARSRRSCRWRRAPITRSSISDSDEAHSSSPCSSSRFRCRWPRTSPGVTARIRAARIANWRRFRSSTGSWQVDRRLRSWRQRLVRRSLRFPLDARPLVRREPAVRPRRLAVRGGGQGRRRLVLLR